MKKFALLIILISLYPQISHAETNHLVITQVQITGGTGVTNNDFIEIYNPTSELVELLGKHIVRRTKTGTSDFIVAAWSESTIIPPNKFYLLAHEDYTTIPVTPDFVFTESISNDNGLAIKQGSSTTIDSVAWGEATNAFIEGQVFSTNPSANNSLTRKFLDDQVIDTQDNSLDFEILASNPRNLAYVEPIPEPEPEPEPEEEQEEPEPEEEPEPTPPVYSSAVVITEFMPNPAGTDSGAEWIKLYSPEFADISGWKLDDTGAEGVAGSTAFTIPDNTHISAGQYVTLTIPSGKFALNNTGGDTVRLLWPDNHVINSVSYNTTAKDGDIYIRQANNSFVWASSLIEEDEEEEEAGEGEEDSEEEVYYSDEIIINEFFPEPDKGVEEFIELKNESDESVNLTGWILSDLAREYVLKDIIIPAGGLVAIYKIDSKISLNNYGTETITLTNPLGEIVAQVEYENSPKNESFNFLDGEYYWSQVITPGQENTIVSASGINSLPRTGKGWACLACGDARRARGLPFGFVLWAGIWYIYVKATKKRY